MNGAKRVLFGVVCGIALILGLLGVLSVVNRGWGSLLSSIVVVLFSVVVMRSACRSMLALSESMTDTGCLDKNEDSSEDIEFWSCSKRRSARYWELVARRRSEAPRVIKNISGSYFWIWGLFIGVLLVVGSNMFANSTDSVGCGIYLCERVVGAIVPLYDMRSTLNGDEVWKFEFIEYVAVLAGSAFSFSLIVFSRYAARFGRRDLGCNLVNPCTVVVSILFAVGAYMEFFGRDVGVGGSVSTVDVLPYSIFTYFIVIGYWYMTYAAIELSYQFVMCLIFRAKSRIAG